MNGSSPETTSLLDDNDIVERLNDHALYNKLERMKLFMEAAAEIRRLRAHAVRLEEAVAACAATIPGHAQSLPPSPHVEYVASRGQSKITYWVSREEGDRIRAASVSSTVRDETVKPHIYMPDYQAMGDCRVCGHEQDRPWHAVTRPDRVGTE